MEGHARTWFTPRQRAELWERWRSGQCVADIARALERRNKSGVYRVLALNGGIAPVPPRDQGSFALRLFESIKPNQTATFAACDCAASEAKTASIFCASLDLSCTHAPRLTKILL